jgi:hypothetical protein
VGFGVHQQLNAVVFVVNNFLDNLWLVQENLRAGIDMLPPPLQSVW